MNTYIVNIKPEHRKLSKELVDQSYLDENPFSWVAHPNGLRKGLKEYEKVLIEKRYELELLGGVTDPEASYSYDELCLAKLNDEWILFSTSGCSCPSPEDTWRVEIHSTNPDDIRKFIEEGNYSGYTLPEAHEKFLLSLLDIQDWPSWL